MKSRVANPDNLPPRVYRRDGKRVITWWFKAHYGQTVVLASVPSDSPQAEIDAAVVRAIEQAAPLSERHKEPRAKNLAVLKAKVATAKAEPLDVPLPAWAWRLFRQTKQHAKARRIVWRLTQAEFAAVVRRANGKCEVSGVELVTPVARARGPYGPSIDRIESQKDYNGSNIRIVCVAANLALNRWGVDVFAPIARGLADLYSKNQTLEFTIQK